MDAPETTAHVDCLCAPKADGSVRHPDGDTVTFRERLDFRGGQTARNSIIIIRQEDEDASVAEIAAMLTEVYLFHGIESWSLVDAKGKPVEVERAAIRDILMTDSLTAMTLGELADSLYSDAVMAPLVARAQKSSPTSLTVVSTSATNGSSPTSQKPTKRSSTSISRTAAIAPTSVSHVGDSSSSQSSA